MAKAELCEFWASLVHMVKSSSPNLYIEGDSVKKKKIKILNQQKQQ